MAIPCCTLPLPIVASGEPNMQVRLIVPNRSGRSVDSCTFDSKPIETYGPAIARIAGGFTASQATGGWLDANGVLVVEPVTVFDCDCRDDRAGIEYRQVSNRADADAFRDLARKVKADLRQDCVYLRIDGIVEMI